MTLVTILGKLDGIYRHSLNSGLAVSSLYFVLQLYSPILTLINGSIFPFPIPNTPASAIFISLPRYILISHCYTFGFSSGGRINSTFASLMSSRFKLSVFWVSLGPMSCALILIILRMSPPVSGLIMASHLFS